MLTVQASMNFHAPARDVAALYASPEYSKTRGAAVGVHDSTVAVTGTADEGFTVTTTMPAPIHKIPEKYRRFVGAGMSVTEVQKWSPRADGSYDGEISMTVTGAPASLKGTFTVTPAGGGSRMDIDAALKVSVPLVGGQIEKTAEPYVAQVFAKEEKNANAALRK